MGARAKRRPTDEATVKERKRRKETAQAVRNMSSRKHGRNVVIFAQRIVTDQAEIEQWRTAAPAWKVGQKIGRTGKGKSKRATAEYVVRAVDGQMVRLQSIEHGVNLQPLFVVDGLKTNGYRPIGKAAGKVPTAKPAPRRRSMDTVAGQQIVRSWRGTEYTVQAKGDRYLYDGTEYTSLSAVAKAILTAGGCSRKQINGPKWFGLRKVAS